jgi:DNA-binding GntR family transcriptional regulator
VQQLNPYPIDHRFRTRKLYEQVYDLLKSRIEAGEWGVGSALPNEVDMSRDLGISIGTVRKAREMLVEDGLVERRQGRGTFVLDSAADNDRRMKACLGRSACVIQQALDEVKVNTTHSARKCLKKHFAQALFEAGYREPEMEAS